MAGPKKSTTPVRHVRKIPRISISNKLANELGDIAVRAARRQSRKRWNEETEIYIHATAALTVEKAISDFVSQMSYEIPLPEFRAMVGPNGKLAKSIKELNKHLASEKAPPFEQMRSLYCFGDPESDGLSVRNVKHEKTWRNQFNPNVVKAALEIWLNLLGQLHKRMGRGRSPNSAQADFVRQLAGYWKEDLKAPLGSSRSADYGQTGLFAEFVFAAARGIPEKGARSSRLKWDHVIREISEEKG
jgi:hypothetical protein